MVFGNVKDTIGRTLANVSVSLRDSKQAVIAFGYTNENGNYRFPIPDSCIAMTNIFLQTAFLGYKKAISPFISNKWDYDFILKENPILLDAVDIKNRPSIIKSGDTLSYNVNSFSRPQDRNIGDVIKRLPGVTVDDDGKISFNGQPISNLFIGGDDLMAGRYGLATKAVNKDIVSSIEVLKNHQPVKVLKDKISTNNIAMNLVLKNPKDFTTSADVMLGGGVPAQYDAYLNLITLNSEIKMLNSAKANNSGIDYQTDFKQLGNVSNLGNNNFKKPDFIVNPSNIPNPDLPKQNYYFNHSEIINLNNLINTKKGLQYRLNVQGFLDRNNLTNMTRLENYLPNDTILFNVSQQVKQEMGLLNIGLSVNKNSDKKFINNNTSFNVKKGKFYSPLIFNDIAFNQGLKNLEYDFSSAFSYIPLLKKDAVLSLNINVNYFSNPQNLSIDQGINPEIINNGNAYKGLMQNIRIPTFFSEVSSAYIIPNKLIRQSYQFGTSTEVKHLDSKISLIENATIKYPIGNELRWMNNKVYSTARFGLKTRLWEIDLTTPLQFQRINYNDNPQQLDEHFVQLSINPNLNIKLKTGKEDYITSDLSSSNNVGDINNVYRGNILTNYSTIQNNQANIQVKRNINFGLKYHLEKSIKLAFSNISVNYSQIKANSIAFTLISENVLQTTFVPVKNQTSTLNFGADVSKYFFLLKAKLQGSASFTRLGTSLFLNNELLPYVNKSVNANFGYDTKISQALFLNYNLAYRYGEGGQGKKTLTGFSFANNRLDQFLSMTYTINERFFVEGIGQLVFNNQQNISKSNFFFLNTNFKYKFIKPSLEINADLSNLLNTRNYTISSLTSNQLSESRYNIRGSMAIMRVKFIY